MAYKIKQPKLKERSIRQQQELTNSFKIIDEEFDKLARKKRLTKFEKQKLLYINDIYKYKVPLKDINNFASLLKKER